MQQTRSQFLINESRELIGYFWILVRANMTSTTPPSCLVATSPLKSLPNEPA